MLFRSAQAETLYFLETLRERQMPFGGFVVNRTVHAPAHTLDPSRLPDRGPMNPDDWAKVLHAVTTAPEMRRLRAARQNENLGRLRAAAPRVPMWLVSDRPTPVADLDALVTLGSELPASLW